MKVKFNYNDWLYLVTDSNLTNGRELTEVVRQALEGGVTMVQIREKDLSGRAFFELATAIHTITLGCNIPLIINDRLDIALAINAEGVHLGQQDIPVSVARRVMGESSIIGLSIDNQEQLERCKSFPIDYPIDYIGLGPVFNTTTKIDIPNELGLLRFKELVQQSPFPCVAIGGITLYNAKDVISAGANGLCVVSAICMASDIKQTTLNLKQQLTKY